MRNTLKTDNGYIVDIEQIKGNGAPWIVRSYRRIGIFRKKLSSDWFLNEDQARTFAGQLLKDLASDESAAASIRTRKPGWTLHRAPR